jgi:hypothetical protein
LTVGIGSRATSAANEVQEVRLMELVGIVLMMGLGIVGLRVLNHLAHWFAAFIEMQN